MTSALKTLPLLLLLTLVGCKKEETNTNNNNNNNANPFCGDGTLDSGEVCDDGNTVGGDGCSADCTSNETCGNGIFDALAGEQCDAGSDNGTAGNACKSDCTLTTCGDGYIGGAESCDGSDLNGASCTTLGFDRGTATCDATCLVDTSACTRCGDGNCDEANGEDRSNCAADCNFTDVGTGRYHSCAVRGDGAVYCWGTNDDGQLGDNTTTSRPTPIRVPGIDNAVRVTCGELFTCVVLDDGTARCWGDNFYGNLGDTTTNPSPVPVTVMGLTDAVEIDAGLHHVCAVKTGGTVECWGRDSNGELGDGAPLQASSVPVPVTGLTGAVDISCGLVYSCARRAGDIWCWGNDSNQFGNGSAAGNVTTAAPAFNGFSNPLGLAAGYAHTCIITSGGTVACAGVNFDAQLGIVPGAQTASASPIATPEVSNAASLGAGWHHTCAVIADGTVKCWGEDIRNVGNRTALNAVGDINNATSYDGDWSHGCALTSTGGVACWGRNDEMQLGTGTGPGIAHTAVPVVGLEP